MVEDMTEITIAPNLDEIGRISYWHVNIAQTMRNLVY